MLGLRQAADAFGKGYAKVFKIKSTSFVALKRGRELEPADLHTITFSLKGKQLHIYLLKISQICS